MKRDFSVIQLLISLVILVIVAFVLFFDMIFEFGFFDMIIHFFEILIPVFIVSFLIFLGTYSIYSVLCFISPKYFTHYHYKSYKRHSNPQKKKVVINMEKTNKILFMEDIEDILNFFDNLEVTSNIDKGIIVDFFGHLEFLEKHYSLKWLVELGHYELVLKVKNYHYEDEDECSLHDPPFF